MPDVVSPTSGIGWKSIRWRCICNTANCAGQLWWQRWGRWTPMRGVAGDYATYAELVSEHVSVRPVDVDDTEALLAELITLRERCGQQ